MSAQENDKANEEPKNNPKESNKKEEEPNSNNIVQDNPNQEKEKEEEEDINNRSSSEIEVNIEIFITKLVFIGDSNVGKTSIIRRFCENKFDESNIISTVQATFKTKKIKIDSFTEVSMEIWDTMGQERFKSLTRGYLRDSHGVFLVFDFSQKKTFDSLEFWLDEIKNSDVKKNCVVMLIGNKFDCENKEVDIETAKKFVEEKNLQFLPVSAKEGINIEQMFETMGNACAKILQEELDENNLDLKSEKKKKEEKPVIKIEEIKKEIKIEKKKNSCC